VPVLAEKVAGPFALHSEAHEAEAGGKQKQCGGFGCGGGGGLFRNGEGVENESERGRRNCSPDKGEGTWKKRRDSLNGRYGLVGCGYKIEVDEHRAVQ
jgi:hypothetical protein